MKDFVTDEQKEQLASISRMKRWNEFKDYTYHQGLWERFWTRTYKGCPEDEIMDFGCGPCWGAYMGNALGFHNITNLDIDNEEVRTSFKHYTDILGQSVCYWDGCKMDFETDRFNAVVAKASIMKLVGTEFETLVNELCRVTRPGGTWYVAAIYMCRDLVAQLRQTGLMASCVEKKIMIREWTWLPMEKEKMFIRKMCRPVKHVLQSIRAGS